MMKFKKGVRVPAIAEFLQGDLAYVRISSNGMYHLYEVRWPNGGRSYELFERGHLYRQSKFKSSNIRDGEEMYPTTNEFGSWAWSYSTLNHAMEKFGSQTEIP